MDGRSVHSRQLRTLLVGILVYPPISYFGQNTIERSRGRERSAGPGGRKSSNTVSFPQAALALARPLRDVLDPGNVFG